MDDDFRKHLLQYRDEIEDLHKEYAPKHYAMKVGVNNKLPYNSNYRKRRKNDKALKRHHKYLKYPMSLDKRIKNFVSLDIATDLGIKSENDLFIYAVEKILDQYNG